LEWLINFCVIDESCWEGDMVEELKKTFYGRNFCNKLDCLYLESLSSLV
jgi:hypothetical protein